MTALYRIADCANCQATFMFCAKGMSQGYVTYDNDPLGGYYIEGKDTIYLNSLFDCCPRPCISWVRLEIGGYNSQYFVDLEDRPRTPML